MGAALPRLDGGGLAHPLRPAGHPPVGPAGLSARHGGFLHPAAPGRALPPVGLDAGVRGGRRGLRGGHPRPEEHGRLRRRGAGSDRRLLLPLPGASEAAVGAASGGLRGQHSGHLRPHLRGVLAACRHPVAGHPARRMDAGPLLPLLRRHHQLPHQPDQSGDRQARGLLGGGHQRHPRRRGGRGEVHHQPGLPRLLRRPDPGRRTGEAAHHPLRDGRVLLGRLGAGTVRLPVRHRRLGQPPRSAADQRLWPGLQSQLRRRHL